MIDEFVNPNPAKKMRTCMMQPHCGCHATKPVSVEQALRHENEFTRRLAWCINNNFTPAHENIHKAPGDDSNFVYGVAPWHSDEASILKACIAHHLRIPWKQNNENLCQTLVNRVGIVTNVRCG